MSVTCASLRHCHLSPFLLKREDQVIVRAGTEGWILEASISLYFTFEEVNIDNLINNKLHCWLWWWLYSLSIIYLKGCIIKDMQFHTLKLEDGDTIVECHHIFGCVSHGFCHINFWTAFHPQMFTSFQRKGFYDRTKVVTIWDDNVAIQYPNIWSSHHNLTICRLGFSISISKKGFDFDVRDIQ